MIGMKAGYEWFGGAVLDAVDVAAKPILLRQGERIASEVRASIVPRNRPSRPGEPPSSHTGKLRNNIEVSYEPRSLKVTVSPRDLGLPGDVPADLEFGTNRIEARPYLNPVFDRYMPRLIQDWHGAIE